MRKNSSFIFLGIMFKPAGTLIGDFALNSANLSSSGISNYQGERFRRQNYRSNQWNYDAFYLAAGKLNETVDVFSDEKGEQFYVPCQNELMKFGGKFKILK